MERPPDGRRRARSRKPSALTGVWVRSPPSPLSPGDVAERLKAAPCYGAGRVTDPQVRILPSPSWVKAPFVHRRGRLVVCEERAVRFRYGAPGRTYSEVAQAVERLAVHETVAGSIPALGASRGRERWPLAGLICQFSLGSIPGSPTDPRLHRLTDKAARFSAARSEFDSPWSHYSFIPM